MTHSTIPSDLPPTRSSSPPSPTLPRDLRHHPDFLPVLDQPSSSHSPPAHGSDLAVLVRTGVCPLSPYLTPQERPGGPRSCRHHLCPPLRLGPLFPEPAGTPPPRDRPPPPPKSRVLVASVGTESFGVGGRIPRFREDPCPDRPWTVYFPLLHPLLSRTGRKGCLHCGDPLGPLPFVDWTCLTGSTGFFLVLS